jgi:hypothetical protein
MKTKSNSMLVVAAGFALCAAGVYGQETAASAQGESVLSPGLGTVVRVAYIPAGSNLSSIKYQGTKAVTIATKSGVTMDARYCEEANRRDPGGSMYCPLVQPGAFERVYQVTYSYEGRPLASDEYGNTHFTFSVYFRPQEIAPAERQILLAKGARSDAAGLFAVTTSREDQARVAEDQEVSTHCEGSYVDGSWVQAEPNCKDHIQYKTVMVPSEYVAVKVELPLVRAAASAE